MRQKKTKSQAPCQYTVDELKDRLSRGREAVKVGACKTQSEMKRKQLE